MHGNSRRQSDRLLLGVAIVHLTTQLFEQSLKQLHLIVHDFDDGGLGPPVPQHQVFLQSLTLVKSLAKLHVADFDVVLVVYTDNFDIVVLDLFVMLVVFGASDLAESFHVYFLASSATRLQRLGSTDHRIN